MVRWVNLCGNEFVSMRLCRFANYAPYGAWTKRKCVTILMKAIEQLPQPWFICCQKDIFFPSSNVVFYLFILQCPSGNEDQEITTTNVRVWRR